MSKVSAAGKEREARKVERVGARFEGWVIFISDTPVPKGVATVNSDNYCYR